MAKVVVVALGVLAAAAFVLSEQDGSGPGVPASRVAPVAGGAVPGRLGRTDPRLTIRVGLVLRTGRDRALNRFVADVRTPGSPEYRRFLSASEFGARFGATHAELAALRHRLRGRGLAVARVYPERTSLVISGPVGRIGRSFAVRFEDYRNRRGQRFYRALGTPRVPRDLAPYVTDVAGLSNEPARAADIPVSGLKPIDVARAYDIQPLYDSGMHGEGQTVAIVSLAPFNASDIADYDHNVLHGSGPPIQHVAVKGGAAATNAYDEEVAIDTQIIRGIAPKAQIVNYEGGSNTPLAVTFADIYNQIVADGRAKVVSNSYGLCETGASPGDVKLVGAALKAMVAHGITSFFASGDSGAFDCQHSDPRLVQKVIDFHGGDPNTVDVGGTLLAVRRDGSYLNEQAWSATLELAGTGGGISMFNKRPAWQAGPGVLQAGPNPNGMRQDPDVSGPADPDSGFAICLRGQCTGGYGGTSASAPFWAGSAALIAEYAQRQGAGQLGYMNPVLYKLAATPQRFPPFHDIVRGNNRAYEAGPGWDYATGLGTPDVANLAQDYTDFLKHR